MESFASAIEEIDPELEEFSVFKRKMNGILKLQFNLSVSVYIIRIISVLDFGLYQ